MPSILELQYENVLSGATRAFMDENCRLSNVSRLLHEHDKEILIADLEKMKIKLPDLEVRLVQAAQELQRAQAGIVQLYGILRARSREVNQLKAGRTGFSFSR